MKISVLGPLSLSCDIRQLRAPTAPKQRTVLGMLVIHADRYLSASTLIRELWSEELPATAATTLQTYILSLRKSLSVELRLSTDDIANHLLITESGGYRLNDAQLELDSRDFHRLARAGREAFSAGDDESAESLLTAALALWRGPALVDVPVGPSLEAHRLQLHESWLVATEYLAETRLRQGRHREVCAELAGVVRENPLHEGLHTQYMRALCLWGRRDRALAVFQDLRQRLVEELGLEPMRETQEVFRAILGTGSSRIPHGLFGSDRGGSAALAEHGSDGRWRAAGGNANSFRETLVRVARE